MTSHGKTNRRFYNVTWINPEGQRCVLIRITGTTAVVDDVVARGGRNVLIQPLVNGCGRDIKSAEAEFLRQFNK